MDTVEFRVRPVERYTVTKYTSNSNGGGCITLGEYPNADMAVEAKQAFESAESVGTIPVEYVIVLRGFEPATSAYYASSRAEAVKLAEQLTSSQGGEWRIYGRS